MNKKIFLLITMLTISLSFISYKATYSFFTGSASSTTNTFAAAAVFPTPTPSPPPTSPPIANHLVINEVLYDTSTEQNITGQGGSSRGEFVEIYNPTVSPVNVNGWTVEDSTDSETLPNISIPAGGFLILTGATETEFEGVWTVPASVVYAQAAGGSIGNGFDNAGERAILKDSLTNIVDQASWGGDTTIFNPASPDVAAGHSLERDPDGIDTNASPDFVDRTTPTPGL
jgi:hypothetical protein